MKRWYAVYCKPRQDIRAAEHLGNQAYEVFQPRVRVRRLLPAGVRQRIEPLFPRYLFIRLDDTEQSWAPIRSTRGVAGLVHFGATRLPTPVPDALVDDLLERVAADGLIDLPSEREFAPNERVVVATGAFAGLDAVFQARSGPERVVVLLALLGAERSIELPDAAVVRKREP